MSGYGSERLRARLPETYEYAKKPLKLNIEEGDEVVIVTDTKTEAAAADALFNGRDGTGL